MFEQNPLQKLSSLLLALVLVLAAACAGNDGEPGPKGDAGADGAKGADGTDGTNGADAVSKLGYFQGTVAGHRQDGTAFSEAFNFEYAYGNDQGRETEWLLQRFETAQAAILNAAIVNAAVSKGQTPALNVAIDNGYVKMLTAPEQDGKINPTAFFLSFSKGLNDNQIFRLSAQPYLEDDINYHTRLAMGPEALGIYKFYTNALGKVIYNTYDVDGDGDDENEVSRHLSTGEEYTFYYDVKSGELQFIYFNYEQIDDAAMFNKYDDIKFVSVENPSTGDQEYMFVKTDGGSALWEDIGIVPVDAFTITNYKHEGGVVSFDFSISISKYRGFIGHFVPGPIATKPDGINTTGHDLTITGKFSTGGKFYTEEVGRERG